MKNFFAAISLAFILSACQWNSNRHLGDGEFDVDHNSKSSDAEAFDAVFGGKEEYVDNFKELSKMISAKETKAEIKKAFKRLARKVRNCIKK